VILLLHHNPNFNPNLSLIFSLITTIMAMTLETHAICTARKRGDKSVLKTPVASDFVQSVQKKANA
jgi:hypothetical protein